MSAFRLPAKIETRNFFRAFIIGFDFLDSYEKIFQ